MNHPLRRMAIVACLALVGLAAMAFGQTATSAAIVGTVTDPSGAVVVGAEITLTDILTNQKLTARSNEAGQYSFFTVPSGTYRLTVSMTGFRQATVEPVSVDVAKSYMANVRLEVGQVTETVQVVTGAGAELQTLDSAVGQP